MRQAVIREASYSDQNQISKIQLKNGITPDKPNDWERIWSLNSAHKPDTPIGWVLEVANEIVGYIGNVSRLYYLNKEPIYVYCARGWAIEYEYRNQAIMLVLKYLTQNNADLLINSSSNEPTYKIFKLLGCKTLPNKIFDSISFWITSPEHFTKALLKKSKILILSRVAYLPLSLPLYVISYSYLALIKLKKNKFKKKFPNQYCKVLKIEKSSGEINALFTKYLSKNKGLVADRSLENLLWFTQRDSQEISILGLYENSSLTGYMILYQKIIFNTDCKKMELTDFIVLNDNPESFEHLLTYAIDYAFKLKVSFFEITPTPEKFCGKLKKMWPIKRKRFSTPFTYKVINKSKISPEFLENKANWHITNFDGDSSL